VAGAPVDLDVVREIALGLPDVVDASGARGMAFKVRGKLLACSPTNRSAEPGSFAVRTHFDLRAELLASRPDVYYVTPHYEGHPVVLLRLARVDREELCRLLGAAWAFVTASRPRSRAGRPKGMGRATRR